MSSIKLSPVDNNYLTSRLVFNNIQQNQQEVELAEDTSATITPKVVLDGSGRAYLQGRLTITAASPTANMLILDLPETLIPSRDFILPVTVLRDDAPVANYVSLEAKGGAIISGTITSAGVYDTMPTLTAVGEGSGASLAASMTGVTVAIASAGTGYAPGDSITVTGGTFSSVATLAVTTTKLVSAAVNAAGSGYAPSDVITVTGGGGLPLTNAQLTVATTRLVSVALNAAGTGYAENDTITLSGGTSSIAAVITVDTVDAGAIATFHISTPGSYTVNSATFTQASTSGSGTGATFNAGLFGVLTTTVSTGGVYLGNATSFTQFTTTGSGTGATFNTLIFGVNAAQFAGVVAPGGIYTVLPTNPISQGSTTGTGTGATFNFEWGLYGVIVSAGGIEYHQGTTTLSISGGGGTGGGAGTLTVDSSSTGSLQLMLEPQENDVVVLDSVFFFVDSYN